MSKLSIFVIAAAVLVCNLAHAADAVIEGDKNNINTACAADAATAGCGSEKVGSGLLKCLHAYKKAHKGDFTFQPACKTAMETMHADKKAGK